MFEAGAGVKEHEHEEEGEVDWTGREEGGRGNRSSHWYYSACIYDNH